MPSTTDDIAYSLDPVLWSKEVLGYHADPWQADLLRSRSRKIILNCSRQSGKSTTSAVLALHESIYRKPSFVLIVAPTQDQSGELMMKFDEFRSAVELPSDYLDTDTKLAVRFSNGNRVVARPGSEKSARSFSAVTLLLEDEASRVSDDLYNTVRPMLAVSDGRHILMSTPFGKRGHFHQIWENERDLWDAIEVPAEMCPRISKEFLAEEKRTNPWYLQEYCCAFTETIDQLFSYDLVQSMLEHDEDSSPWGSRRLADPADPYEILEHAEESERESANRRLQFGGEKYVS